MIRELRLEKVVINIGLGVHDAAVRQAISSHFKKLFDTDQDMKATFCKKPNAKWKTRRGTPLGLMITLRKARALNILRVLRENHKSFRASSYSNNSIMGGVRSHRQLNLSAYNHSDPEYGFSYIINVGFKGDRCWKRKRNRAEGVPELGADKVWSFVTKDLC